MMTKQERMYRLIERQQASGLTVKAFCEQEQIKLHTFHYWLRKKRQTTSAAFIPIDTGREASHIDQVELIYPNQVRIRLKHFDLKQIQQLIDLNSCSA